MAQVVLAVAECPLAVFPRLAPMDRRQRDQQSVLSSAERLAPHALVEDAAQFDRVTIRRVVVHGRLINEAGQRSADHVRLGWMKVSAGRVHPEGPPRGVEALPCRQPQRMPEHVAERRGAQRCGRQLALARLIERRTTGCVPICCDARRRVQREDRRSGKPTEGARLRRPVEVSERSSERVEMMLRAVVIAVHRRERRLSRLALMQLCGSRHVDLIILSVHGARGRAT